MGYRFILFTYRQNKLAKWISGQEQYVRDLEKPKVLKRKGFVHREPFAPPKSVISKWEATCRHMRDAERAAVQYGMRVMRMDFMEVVTNPCNATAKILAAWLNDVPHNRIEGLKCEPTMMHVYPHANGLANRMGEENALEIERQLKGTAYEWMLDLHATQWPQEAKGSVCCGW
mmetsp:Transcript_4482/g.16074  ORF Transcript_4482/g.16074 Transcript_4482/m.16074 type:complete len:173 (+) Transcript_4482:883-1401(+)